MAEALLMLDSIKLPPFLKGGSSSAVRRLSRLIGRGHGYAAPCYHSRLRTSVWVRCLLAKVDNLYADLCFNRMFT